MLTKEQEEDFAAKLGWKKSSDISAKDYISRYYSTPGIIITYIATAFLGFVIGFITNFIW